MSVTHTMNNYRYLNLNPEKHDTQDCTIRAISLFLNKDWDDVYLNVAAEGLKQKRMPSSDSVWGAYLELEGCMAYRIPHECPYCYSVKEFANEHKRGTYLLKVEGHVVCVINGYYYDTWDSGNEIVLYYWERSNSI